MKDPNILLPDISQISSKAFSPYDWLVEKTHSYHATSSLVAFNDATQAIPIDMVEMVLAKLEADKKTAKEKQDSQDTEDIKAQETTEENAKPQTENDDSEKPKDDSSSFSETQSSDNDNSNTEANVDISQSQVNKYLTPLPNPLSIRDGWDEDYANIGIGNNTSVLSQERNLDVFSSSFYVQSFYTEVLPSTVSLATEEGCGCSCDCDLSGQWTLVVLHDPGEWGEEVNIAGIINSITLNFSNGLSFSSDTSLSWDDPNLPPYNNIPYYLNTMSILVEDACADLPLSMTVTLDLEIPNGDGLVLTLFAPNGSSIVLLSGFNSDGSNSSSVLGYNGVYELDDSDLSLPNLTLDPNFDNDSGTPDGDIDTGIYNTYNSGDGYSLTGFLNDACSIDECGCACDVNGYWTLWLQAEFEGSSDAASISVSSWEINFGDGQTFTSPDANMVVDPGSSGLWQWNELLVQDIQSQNISDFSISVYLDIANFNNGAFSLTLEAPNGTDMYLVRSDYGNEDEINQSGVYTFTYSASQYFGSGDPESFVSGEYLPHGALYNDPNIYIQTFEQYMDTICTPYEGGENSSEGETAPIVFDLDGDGFFNLLSHEESNVLFDVDNDGIKEQTAWVGPNDGILVFDLFDDKQITNVNEFSFANWHPDAKSDLEGLQLVFDSNKDNILDAQDVAWKQMGIWQDKNQNGITDAGEYSSLDDLGILSINLTSDGHLQMLNGNTILGTISAQKVNGESLAAADVLLSYSEVPQTSDSKMPIAEWAPPPPVLQEVAETVEL
ncbi:hypothetical protein CC99x_005980 [Candidatus Berkiella cookevillensis]|uniref:Proprotein convertase P-domain protein n=1 Tax=Candidatus Berkiella cookevillensis TaxID=437022 RepID=A0A0Q9YTQ2_9GAMM|nr:hypothetical protein [Candidatus Berkiella cookevillensis]MCS5708453.1 hypothetical protein [Candidatus Berkiella cookevillensis]